MQMGKTFPRPNIKQKRGWFIKLLFLLETLILIVFRYSLSRLPYYYSYAICVGKVTTAELQ